MQRRCGTKGAYYTVVSRIVCGPIVLSNLQLVRALQSCRLYPRTPYFALQMYQSTPYTALQLPCDFPGGSSPSTCTTTVGASFCGVNGKPYDQQNNGCAEQSTVLYEHMDTAWVSDILSQFSPSPSILVHIFHLLAFARLIRPNKEHMTPIIFLCLSKIENMAP